MSFFDRFKTKFEQRKTNRTAKGEQEVSDTKTEAKKTSEEVEKAVTPKAHVSKSKEALTAYKFLVRPFVTEKSATLAGQGKYAFVVNRNATKLTVKRAVKEVYDVMPETVNIMNRIGKAVRFGRFNGNRKDWKIAVVTLPKGKTLPIYD